MRIAAAVLSLAPAWAADDALWSGLEQKRAGLAGYRQEFSVTRTFRLPGHQQAVKTRVVLDAAGGRWREKSIDGAGVNIRLWDGADFFHYEEGGGEVVRVKRKDKDGPPVPPPYHFADFDLVKLREQERRPCGLPGLSHQCVLIEVPLKASARSSGGGMVRRMPGTARLFFDLETGLLLARSTTQPVDSNGSAYVLDLVYTLTQLTPSPPEAAAMALPPGLREVKELSNWNAARMKKELGGKPAPDLTLRGLRGETISLAAYRGKTVLLDFWTTWCPPCRADAPSLDKLHRKFGGKELAIVGVSVNEDRAVVEKFLAEHPHAYPTALTTENEMPRPYQIGVFPTYIVIAPDGTFSAAVEGDQGFGALQRLLKKAGLDLD